MIEELKNTYEQDIDLPSGATYNQPDLIRRTNCNWDGIYADDSGDDKVLGKRPYDNSIVVARVLLEARATDFSVSNIDAEPKNASRKAKVSALIQRKAYQRYARKHNLPRLFDKITFTAPKYGGVLVKHTKDGIHVVPWENAVTDQVDILGNPILERVYMRPSEVLGMKSWKNKKEVVMHNATQSIDATVSDTDANKTAGRHIEVWEMTGEITLSQYKDFLDDMGEEQERDDEDEYTYLLAHVVKSGDTVMFCEEIKEEDYPYMYYARNPQTGRALGQSVFEQLREIQKWHNFTKTEEMRLIAIAGKIFYETDDEKLFSKVNNVYRQGIDHGTVLFHNQGTSFRQVNNTPATIPAYQSIREEMNRSADNITSSYASVTGAEQKAGTPYRAQALQNQLGTSQFSHYRDQIGEQLIRPMIEKWVMPAALKELEDDLYDEFAQEELELIDEVLVEKAKTRAIVDAAMAGRVATQEDVDAAALGMQEMLNKNGNKRMLKNVKKALDTTLAHVAIHVTDEFRHKGFLYESFANLLSQLQPGDPRREILLDKIFEMVGISTEEVNAFKSPMQQPMQQPVPSAGGALKTPDVPSGSPLQLTQ